MKRTLAALSLATAIAATLGSGLAAAEPITIKFSHVVAENTPKGLMATKFKELVAERMADKVVVEVYPNSQLFGDANELEAMQLGDVHLVAPALSKFSRYTDQLALFDLPFLFNNLDAVDRFQKSDKGQALLASMEKKGLIGLGYLHSGLKQISSSKPLRVPEDAARLKFRIMSSPVLEAQFKALDATAIKKPFSEVFTLLQTKAIDGQENTWSNIYSKKFFEVQPYITETNHGLLEYMVVTSTDFWSGLTDEVREGLQAALDESIEYGNKIAYEKELADRQAILDSKRSQILELTPEERALWVETMRPVWKKFEGEIGADLIEAAFASNQD